MIVLTDDRYLNRESKREIERERNVTSYIRLPLLGTMTIYY